MAECHPVGFQWVMEAKARGATIIHVDPRFTRTSAVADVYVPLRAGSDIAFLGGLVNYVLTHEADFREYVVAYTNAGAIIDESFQDTEDLDGLFSGYDPETHSYDPQTWQYEGAPAAAAAGDRATPGGGGSDQSGGGGKGGAGAQGGGGDAPTGQSHGSGGPSIGAKPKVDPTLQHPRCVYQILKRHFARYTADMVHEVCGVDPEQFRQVAEALVGNSGRERTTAFCYAVGWTHHTSGVQYIRTASILQTLLGNIGRPGGGIMALRGHASIQGSTDIPTLFEILPGYLPMPQAQAHQDLESYVAGDAGSTGFWGNMTAYAVSLLKAWWGDAATADNDYCFDYLPRITGDHGTYQTVLDQIAGKVKGYFVVGQNPAVGSANAKAQRLGMANLDWLVVRDMVEIESATFWRDGPEIETGELRTEEIGTEVFFLPAAAHTEKDGTFTNTQRMLQWHHKAVEPPGQCRSELWFYYHLGRIIRAKLAGSTDERDRPVLDLTWDYPTIGKVREPTADAVLREINGTGPDGAALSAYGSMPMRSIRRPGASPDASRAGSRRSGDGPGRPTGGSSTTARRPIPTASRGANAKPTSGGTTSSRSGPVTTCRTSSPTSGPTMSRPTARPHRLPSAGATRSSCKPMAKPGCTCRPAWPTARCPRTTSRPSRRSEIPCTRGRRTTPPGRSTSTRSTRPTPRPVTSSPTSSPPTG